MSLIQFTRNFNDHSTDKGYQFEFFCDRCGNGFTSEFKASATGMAASALRAAGGLFGGILGSAGSSAYEIERAIQVRRMTGLSRGRLRGETQLPAVPEVCQVGLPFHLLESEALALLRVRARHRYRTGGRTSAGIGGADQRQGAAARHDQGHRSQERGRGVLSGMWRSYSGRKILSPMWKGSASEERVLQVRQEV